MRPSNLNDLCEEILLDWLSDSLKETIRRLFRLGFDKPAVMSAITEAVRRQARGPQQGTVTLAACDLWCDKILKERA